VDDVRVEANVIDRCVGAGIAIGHLSTGLVISGNSITNMVAASDTSRAGIILTDGPASGRVEGNSIDGATFGMRFNSISRELIIGPNKITGVQANFRDLTNVTQGKP
jgi:nitrous oxidase accessory protein NosD